MVSILLSKYEISLSLFRSDSRQLKRDRYRFKVEAEMGIAAHVIAESRDHTATLHL